jgi:hypothetical protein
MTLIDIRNTLNSCFKDLENTYGDNIDFLEVYDGKIIVHFKKDYIEEKIAEVYLEIVINVIKKVMGWNK